MAISSDAWLGFGASLFGGIASLIGAKQQQKQYYALMQQQMRIAQANLEQQRQLATPFLNAGIEGMSMVRRYAQDARSNLERKNDILDQQRDSAMAQANRAIARAKANTQLYFGSNEGRSRGEQMRIERQGMMTKNQVLLDWAKQTQSEKLQNRQQFLAAASQLGNMGTIGTNIMTQAYNTNAQLQNQALANYPINTSLSDLGGALLGFGLDTLAYSRYKEQMKNNGAQ